MNIKKISRILIFSFLVFLILFNIVAFMHAYRLTHVIDQGKRTHNPEALSALGKMRVLFTGVTIIKRPNENTPENYGYRFVSKTIYGKEIETPVWEISCKSPKRTVILFHGNNSNKSSLLSLADWFIQQSSSVVLVDFPGCGDSPYHWTTVGYREAEVVNDVFMYYRSNLDCPIILYGISLGASSIMTAFHRYPLKPEGVILEMPFGSLLQTVRQRFKLMGFPVTFPFAEMLVFWGSVQMGTNAFAFNPAEYAKDVTVPALLFGGGKDIRAPSKMLYEMYDQFQNMKKIYIFENAGHYSPFSPRNDEYCQSILEFFKDIE